MPAKVVSSAALPFDIGPILGDDVVLAAPKTGSFSRPELVAELSDAVALISLLTVDVDEALLAAAPNLRVVANHAVGYDNVDVAAASRRGIAVTNTPDVLTEATADFALALLLAAARRVVEGHALAASGTWTGWEPGQLLGADVHGKTLGIVGYGRIGRAVARRARGFSMTVLHSGRGRAAAADDESERVSLDELLARSDFVSLHCPLTADTRDLIDRDALAKMRPGAFLINTARGGCVDQDALLDALDGGEIAGAALDVFRDEPHIPARMRTCERVTLAPHVGSATTSARRRMGEICAQAVRDVLDGVRPATVINGDAL